MTSCTVHEGLCGRYLCVGCCFVVRDTESLVINKVRKICVCFINVETFRRFCGYNLSQHSSAFLCYLF